MPTRHELKELAQLRLQEAEWGVIMDYEVLVKELRHLVAQLQQEQAHIALFMVKAVETETDDWNLIISTQEYDLLSTKQAMHHFANIIKTHLAPEIRTHILRLTILKTYHAFVQEINATHPVTNAPQQIQSVFIGNIFLEKAIIFASHRFPVPKRTLTSKKPPRNILQHA